MKPLIVLARIAFVGCLWSIIFIEGIRVIMLENWHFDIFWPPHWMHAWNLWLNGWVIDTAKEWAFILIIIAFIPLWLTGWIALSLIPWEAWMCKAVMYPVNLVRSMFNPLKIVTKSPVVVKKKSYKEIRPSGPRSPIYDYSESSAQNTAPSTTASVSAPVTTAPADTALSSSARKDLKAKAANARETFSHSLFNLDDDDDDFDLDFDSFGKSDIFKTDNKKKNDKSESKSRDSRNNRFEFNEADDNDEDYRPSRYDNKSRRDDNDTRSRRKKYDDDDDYNDRPRRRDDRNNRDERNSRDGGQRDNKRREDNRSGDDFNNKNKNTAPSAENSQSASAPRLNPVADVLTQKGYAVISGTVIKNTIIDFIGVSSDKICLCLLDKEAGDWLADEERFNDEEPLWFSENSHRISPVRKADVARQILTDKLESSDLSLEVKTFVIIQTGNIINAEDMFEVWDNMGIEVTRINRGMPKEIKLFSKTIEEAEGKPDKVTLDTVKKLIRSLS